MSHIQCATEAARLQGLLFSMCCRPGEYRANDYTLTEGIALWASEMYLSKMMPNSVLFSTFNYFTIPGQG